MPQTGIGVLGLIRQVRNPAGVAKLRLEAPGKFKVMENLVFHAEAVAFCLPDQPDDSCALLRILGMFFPASEESCCAINEVLGFLCLPAGDLALAYLEPAFIGGGPGRTRVAVLVNLPCAPGIYLSLGDRTAPCGKLVRAHAFQQAARPAGRMETAIGKLAGRQTYAYEATQMLCQSAHWSRGA